LIQRQKKAYFFDLKTGVLVQKHRLDDSVNDRKIVFDFHNNIFYGFKTQTSPVKIEGFGISNFKKGGASSGFAKDHLNKRISNFKALAFGE
jgi:hypothetical protein